MDSFYTLICVLSITTLSIKVMQIYVLTMILSPLVSVWLVFTDKFHNQRIMYISIAS